MKNIKSIIFNSESFKFDDSNYAKLDQVNNFQKEIEITHNTLTNYDICIKNNQIVKGETLGVGQYSGARISLVDKNNVLSEMQDSSMTGYISVEYSGTAARAFLASFNPKLNASDFVTLEVGYREPDNYYTYAPNPNVDSNDNNIATTSWVNAKINNFANVNVISDESQITEDGIYFIVE